MNANYSTNGSTLEDCFTNTFALADLGNIKWRSFSLNHEIANNNQDNTLDCPILSSYIKCLNRDILCVWRRIINNTTGLKDNLNSKHYSKQLWCFWFNCEPEWKQLIHKECVTCDQGDYDHCALSYEIRTLLFKAYHNLIEQSLISIGFCKLGRYFIYPIDQQSQQQTNNLSLFNTSSFNHSFNKSTNHHDDNFSKTLQQTISLIANSNKLACSFSFFIHGENTVCCIIDVRLKNPVYKLTKSHLMNSLHQQQIDVILSPYGLAAKLTGNSFKETDNQVQKLINDWRKFFPTIQFQTTTQSTQQSKDSKQQFKTGSLISPFQLESLEDTFNSINKQSSTSNNNQISSSQLPTMIEGKDINITIDLN